MRTCPAAILSEAASNLMGFIGHAATGPNAWFGWPKNELHEKLRDKWAKTSPEDHLAVAKEIQRERLGDFVPHIYMGQYTRPSAWRSNVRGVLHMR